jgi:hypothetical protein
MQNFPLPISKADLNARLGLMPEPWRGVVEPYVRAWSDRGAFVDIESQALFVGHRPEVGPLSFALCFFPPTTSSSLAEYEAAVGVALPKVSGSLLLAFNGAQFFEFTVYGADPFYAQSPWPERRPYWHCNDMGTDQVVRQRHSSSSSAPVIVADRNASLNVVLAYAEQSTGRIVATNRESGDLVATWENSAVWLAQELRAASEFTSEWCAALSMMLNANKRCISP